MQRKGGGNDNKHDYSVTIAVHKIFPLVTVGGGT